MSEWKKKGKEQLRKIWDACNTLVKNTQIPEEAKREVEEMCVIDAIKLLRIGEPSIPKLPLPRTPQVEACFLEAPKAPTPQLRAEFLAWCLANADTKPEAVEVQFSAPADQALHIRTPSSEQNGSTSPIRLTKDEALLAIHNACCTTRMGAPTPTESNLYQFTPEWQGDLIKDLRASILEIVPDRVYAYNHYRALKPTLTAKGFSYDKVLFRQLSAIPNMFLLYVPRRTETEQPTIILVDPVGIETPIASDFVKPLFKPDFVAILGAFLKRAKAREGDSRVFEESQLREYKIQICISHAHPDHWGGLSLLLEQLRALGYAVDQIPVYVPKGFKLSPRATEWENKYMVRQVGCSRELIDDIRLLCDLYYGANLQMNFDVIEVEDQIKLGDYIFKVYPKIHGGSVMLFNYTDSGEPAKTYHFLDDLFLFVYALSTSVHPTASYESLLRFFFALGGQYLTPEGKYLSHTKERLPPDRDFFFWSHYYSDWDIPEGQHSFRIIPLGPLLGYSDIILEGEDVVGYVEDNFYAMYEAERLEWPVGKLRFFDRMLFTFLYDKGIIASILGGMHQFLRDPAVEEISNIVKSIYDAMGTVDARFQIQWGRFTELDPNLGHSVPMNYDVVQEILWTDSNGKLRDASMTEGGKVRYDPLLFQQALLVIIFIINIVQYCEEEFEARHPHFKSKVM